MRRALGKGLSQLIGEQFEGGLMELPIASIAPNPGQPRRNFEPSALQDLADSIRAVGILQPIVVRPVSEDKYELIAGERRWRAAQIAGLTTISASVRPAGDQGSLELALIENLQREDIGPVECALAYRRLAQEFALSQEQIASKVGKSRVSITNTLRLLKLPATVLEGLNDGTITEGHARALLGLDDPAAQIAMYERCAESEWSVRQTELAVQKLAEHRHEAKRKPTARETPIEWKELSDRISHKLGLPSKLEGKRDSGRIVIEFYGEDDLQRILDELNIQL